MLKARRGKKVSVLYVQSGAREGEEKAKQRRTRSRKFVKFLTKTTTEFTSGKT